MGIVYLATDTRLKRDVALKVLPKEMSTNADAVRRFLREARVSANLNHPNVITVHDVDQERGVCFLVMELVTGRSTQAMLEDGPLTWREATRIVSDACRGLVAAHQIGLVHRDLKPANIMCADDGVVKLADFGLARASRDLASGGPETAAGTLLGTPQYMSPEQCRGEPLDARSDLYSLGATYYALLTGRPPFADSQPLQVMFAHCSKPVPDPRSVRSEIPEACAAIVTRALAKKRADRFSSAREMLAELDAVLSGVPAVTEPATSLGALAVADNSTRQASDQRPTQIRPPETRAAGGADVAARRDPSPAPAGAISARLIQRLANAWARRPRRAAVWIMVAVLLVFAGLGSRNWRATVPAPSAQGSLSKPGEGTPLEPLSDDRRLVLKVDAALSGVEGGIRSLAFSPDGHSIYSGSTNGRLQQWDSAERKAVRTFDGTQGGLHALAVSPGWLVAGGTAKTVWMWDPNSETGLPRATIGDLLGEVSALAISPDGKRLAVGTYSELKLYELHAGGARLLQTLGTSTSGPVISYMVMSVAFSPDSQWLAGTSWNEKAVAVWNAADGKLRKLKTGQPDMPMAIAFVPGQDQAVFGMQSRGLWIWDIGKSVIRSVSDESGSSIRSVVISAGGKRALTVGEWGGAVQVYELLEAATQSPQVFADDSHMSPAVLTISPDGRRLATGGGEERHDHTASGYIHLWSIAAGKSK